MYQENMRIYRSSKTLKVAQADIFYNIIYMKFIFLKKKISNKLLWF